MELNIRAGMRVLYKENGQWNPGILEHGTALLTEEGLYLPVMGNDLVQVAKMPNEIFFDAFKLEDWVKDYSDYFMTKEEYIQFIESEDFDKRLENAYVSDGEYGYYPVSKYTRNWLEKQPFEYVVRVEQ